MKKVLTVISTLLLSFGVLAACGENEATKELDKNDKEKSEAKAGSEAKKEEKKEKEEDIWTHYEDADWSGKWEGVNFEIQKVVVSDKAPRINDEGEEVVSSAVGVKMKVENTTADKTYNVYPDQATLVTSTGEQVEADLSISDHIGGEIHEGVIKEGNVIFYLERGKAEEIKWIKLTWNNDYSDPGGNYDKDLYHEQEVKLDLK